MSDADGWELVGDRHVRYSPERQLRSYERDDGTRLGQYHRDGTPIGLRGRGPRPETGLGLLEERAELASEFPGLDAVADVVEALETGATREWFVGRVTPDGGRPDRGVRVATGEPGVDATVGLRPDGTVETVVDAVRGVAATADAVRPGLRRHEATVERGAVPPPDLPDAVASRVDGETTWRERSVAFFPWSEGEATARAVVGRVPPADDRPYAVDGGTVVVQPAGRYLMGVPADVAPTVVDPGNAPPDAVTRAVESALDGGDRLLDGLETGAEPGAADRGGRGDR